MKIPPGDPSIDLIGQVASVWKEAEVLHIGPLLSRKPEAMLLVAQVSRDPQWETSLIFMMILHDHPLSSLIA